MKAEDLKARLKAAGMTQREAAVALGVTERTVAAYVRGERPIPEPVARLVPYVIGKMP